MRYLLALLVLTNTATLLYLRRLRAFECDDPRCHARDVEFLNLTEEMGKLRRDAGLLARQNIFLAQRLRRARERLVAAEAAVYLRGEAK